ncbi:hypothetical protein ACJ42X_008690 [Klebsiella pneumoniae]|uniref:hypothetical protein n=1 Tax=Klebsiella pneumoniae TaxID=573 RepID=UPI00388DF8D9
MSYETNVFINCPFDDAYTDFIDAALFAVYRCNFKPRCALEINDAGDQRLDKINRIIKDCKIGIHDISRTELDHVNNLPRFNMPLELGLFLGAKKFGSSKNQKSKLAIIVDNEKYRYQKYISDISGQDIMSHDNSPEKFIKIIRDCLSSYRIVQRIPSAAIIIEDYRRFLGIKPALCAQLQLVEHELTFNDKTSIIECYIEFYAAAS